FKEIYTIRADEAKQLDKEDKKAFPDVDYAIVEYPLPLLEKGVAFIDSPGLNDTEARNELSLGYISQAHAILFVLCATQPCTKEERNYLERYIKGQDLNVFFLINQWDTIVSKLEDEDELEEAERKLRQVFRSNLESYCMTEGKNLYEQRVFELNSLGAFKALKKDPPGSLQGTGFDRFLPALDHFLTRERLFAEIKKVKGLARQVHLEVHNKVEERLPQIDMGLDELIERIKSARPEYENLKAIRDNFQGEIEDIAESNAENLADDFYNYLCNLSNTFEKDFEPYQPDLKVLELLRGGKRKEFEAKLQKAFEGYFKDRMAQWTRRCEAQLKEAFVRLGQIANEYGSNYSNVTDKMSEKLSGQTIQTNHISTEDKSPRWAKWAGTAVGLFTGNPAGAVLVGTGALNWKSLVTQFIAVVVGNLVLINLFGAILGPLGIVVVNALVGGAQLVKARAELAKRAKEEMKKELPKLAKEQAHPVYLQIKQTFDTFKKEVISRINEDINSRKTTVDELVAQKQSKEIDRQAEIDRLRNFDREIYTVWNDIDTAYDQFLEKIT
ncbi:dynamin family protein, partial [Geminocystis sp. CENA526]|uniref:dynamin family protein n=1 Tax=Geminocystis sp. CENA526 TaxID=1355871 RepID=UPI003D6F5E42